jgi:FeS assembly SUF system protein
MTTAPDPHADLRKRIVKALRGVHDPEIPVNIYDLGLIYELAISDTGSDTASADIRMTLTAPNCPVADKIPADVERAVRAVPGVTDVTVTLTFDPPWTPDHMTEVGIIELQSMGVDPKRAKEAFTSGSRPTRLTLGRRDIKP